MPTPIDPLTMPLEKLFDDVVARFAAESADIENVFGWRTPKHRGGQQNRICWVPGDASGAVGEVVSAHSPGGNPRSIGTLHEMFTVFIEGRYLPAAENERFQYKMTRLVFEVWYRAAYLSVRNLLKVKSAAWMVDRTTRRSGATLRVVSTIQSKLPDRGKYVAEDVDALVDIQLDSDGDEGTENTSEDMDVPALEEV